MQWWIRTMNLMARAQVLHLERDSPYLWFVCRHWVESRAMTLSFATLSWYWVSFWPLSFLTPEISYARFFVSYFCSYEAWFALSPPETVDFLRIWLGLQWVESMASPALSRISSSGWMPWLVSIVQPSVWRRTSPSSHWCWARFLRLPHQYVRSLCLGTAFPRWEVSWCRLPCRGWWSRREWKNSRFWPECSPLFPRGSEPIGPQATNTWK